MNIAAADWPAISALLDDALALPPALRVAWLDALPGPARAHRATLARLLEHSARVQTADFLGTLPRIELAADGATRQPQHGPSSIGPYRLLSELGRGGMGSVWLAERSDGLLKRAVALKLPHPGLATRAFAERLARERDILAALSHPHIARLYDAGIDADGQPYLALEYVQGQDLLTHCDARRLGPRERIALFQQVLAAVQYAHAQLVIHRDLKPGNVMVADDGGVRLLDFGIAKLMTDGSAQETRLSVLEGRALTPDYASPEQIAGRPLGTASDVYSLGVLLFELLTGERPYRLKHGSRAALEEAILAAEPRRPSQAVGDAARAEARGSTTLRLARALRGDLDAIVCKALAKAPEQRYASADAFARDLDRYIAGEAVLAQPERAWRRAARFMRRHRWGFAAGAGVVMALSAALALALGQARVAQREARTAAAVQGFLEDIFRANSSVQPDPVKARETPARVLLDLGAQRIGAGLADAPEARLSVLATLAGMYDDLGLAEQTVALQRQRVALERRLHGPRDARLARALVDLAGALYQSSTPQAREAPLREAGAILDGLGDQQSALRGELDLRLAELYQSTDLARSIAFARQGVALLRGQAPSYSLVQLLTMQGIAHDARKEYGEAIAVLSEARALSQSLPQGPRRTDNIILAYLAEAHAGLGELPAAEAAYRQALQSARTLRGPEHEDTLQCLTRLGAFLARTGRASEGLDLLREAKALAIRAFGADETFHLPRVRADLGWALIEQGDAASGVAEITAAIELRRRQRGGTRPLALMLEHQALGLVALGRTGEATNALDEASAIRRTAGDAPGSAQFIDNDRARAALALAQPQR